MTPREPVATLPEYWQKLEILTPVSASTRSQAAAFIEIYQEKGYLPLTPQEALALDLSVFLLFYQGLFAQTPELLTGIADRSADSGWMLDYDYCFLNVRAVGTTPEKTGTFLDALKLLPVIRATGFHLAPFFDCAFENLYAVESLRTITDAVVDFTLEAAGVSRQQQLNLFLDAAHLLNKAVGFDLEPHTSQFSRIVLEYPEQFRWIKLGTPKSSLADNQSMVEMLTPASQNQLIAAVKQLVATALAGDTFEDLETNQPQRARAVQGKLVQTLIGEGYWTIPSHTWNGVGLPQFTGYHKNNYPLFSYLNGAGEPHDDHAFGNVTPFKFHDNLPINSYPPVFDQPTINQAGVQFYTTLFDQVRAVWPFDFIRLDYADHIFDAVDPEHQYPLSDRFGGSTLAALTTQVRCQTPGLGVMAECMGEDLASYAAAGVNLILGWEIYSLLQNSYLAENYRLTHKISPLFAGKQGVPASIMWAVDTHDSESPHFWKTGPSQLLGARGLLCRLFVARFGNVGSCRRPKYEVIGNQDLSHGLYAANNQAVNLVWKNDKQFNQSYHTLENIYQRLQPFLKTATLGTPMGTGAIKYWFLDNEDQADPLVRLVCVVYAGEIAADDESLPFEEKYQVLKQHSDALSASGLIAPLAGLNPKKSYAISAYNFISGDEDTVTLEEKHALPVGSLSLHDIRLFMVKTCS